MYLDKFKIKNFRSILDSGFIETKNITSLIGENESGKTNVLLPLWKLNPVTISSDSKLKLIDDYPRKKYNDIYNADPNSDLKTQKFIEAEFVLSDQDKEFIEREFGINVDSILLSRDYNNQLYIELHDNGENSYYKQLNEISQNISAIIKKFEKEQDNNELCTDLKNLESNISKENIDKLSADLKKNNNDKCKKILMCLENFYKLKVDLSNLATSKIYQLIPKFIYYSDYGNLDSAICIPDIIKNNNTNSNKKRTLNTLFEFVNLSPNEIYEMGNAITSNLTDEQKKEMQEKINQRQTLLESAATKFTESFNIWWGQGNYNFKFELDGDYFRIKVADGLRHEYIELEHRSRGLQWFFSFYLVFLVESKKAHKNTILLLDEPGITLHPNSQKDLYLFFETLSQNNQLIYTTHSPFMINPNQLDKVYAVYVNSDGYTEITSDLRHTGNQKRNNSIYPAFAALGLSVSDTLLQGCIPVIVEGISDQIYLSMIKNALINKNILNTNKEIVFVPSSGTKGVKAILTLLSCIESNEYPYIIVDGDKAGLDLKQALEAGIYAGNEDKIITISDFMNDGEIEDLLPKDLIIKTISYYLPKKSNTDDEFEDCIDGNKPICEEINQYCTNNCIELDKGYKVELAKKFKDRVLKRNINVFDKMNTKQQDFVKKIFEKIIK